MTVTAFLIILASSAAITSLLTEGIKKFLDEQKVTYASNILVLAIAVVVGCGATIIYYVNYQIPFTALNSVYLALMGIANWLGATLGYDKVRQTIAQIGVKEG
jgi:Na+/melibiose symporter-like transporter